MKDSDIDVTRWLAWCKENMSAEEYARMMRADIGLSPHLDAIRYSRWERIHFRMFGFWPASVVQRRIDATDADLNLLHGMTLEERTAALAESALDRGAR